MDANYNGCVLYVGIVDLSSGAERVQVRGKNDEFVPPHSPPRPTECGLCFILGAPSSYTLESDSYLTIFLDPYDLKRQLPAQRYQIRCDRPCNASDFALWTEQLITTLPLPFVEKSIVCTDLSDLRVVMHRARNRNLTAQSFTFNSLDDEAIRLLERHRFLAGYGVIGAHRGDLSMELFSRIGIALEKNLPDDATLLLATRTQSTAGYSVLLLHDECD